jgi:hypothetical protein
MRKFIQIAAGPGDGADPYAICDDGASLARSPQGDVANLPLAYATRS